MLNATRSELGPSPHGLWDTTPQRSGVWSGSEEAEANELPGTPDCWKTTPPSSRVTTTV